MIEPFLLIASIIILIGITTYCFTYYFIHVHFNHVRDQIDSFTNKQISRIDKERTEAIKHIDDANIVLDRKSVLYHSDISKKLAALHDQYKEDMDKQYKELMDALIEEVNRRLIESK